MSASDLHPVGLVHQTILVGDGSGKPGNCLQAAVATDLAATLRRLPGASKDQPVDIGDDWHITGDASIAYWLRRHAFTVATALERGERSARCHAEAVKRFARLTTALMESIERGEDQLIQLDLVANACDACDCVDDESIALYERAHAAAAASARDRERGAAAEAGRRSQPSVGSDLRRVALRGWLASHLERREQRPPSHPGRLRRPSNCHTLSL